MPRGDAVRWSAGPRLQHPGRLPGGRGWTGVFWEAESDGEGAERCAGPPFISLFPPFPPRQPRAGAHVRADSEGHQLKSAYGSLNTAMLQPLHSPLSSSARDGPFSINHLP